MEATSADAELKVVSFDLFDTLLIRPFVRPTDLFRLMERIHDVPGFADRRIRAERDAREAVGHRVTLDDIYAQMPDLLDCKGRECEMEVSLVMPNRDMVEELDSYRAQGKKIALASDMYLPRGTIERMLEKSRICYDALFISSDVGKSKHDGTLFRHMLAHFEIGPDEMLHIGDNRYSDYRIPRSLGIRASHRVSPIKRYLKSHFDERRFLKRNDPLTASIIVAMDMLRSAESDPWRELGGRYGGPLVYSYSKYLVDHHGEGSLLLFAARDGYSTEKAVNLLDQSIPTGYAYVQRIFLKMFTDRELLEGEEIHVPGKVGDWIGHRRAVQRLRTVFYFLTDDDIRDSGLEAEYNRRRMELSDSCRAVMEDYRRALAEQCGGRDVELVDCTTMYHSSHRLVEMMLGRSIRSHDLIVLRDFVKDAQYDCFCKWPHRSIGWSRVDLPEFLMCSPELPVRSWRDGEPVYDEDVPESEKLRASRYPDLCDAELGYVKMIMDTFGDYLPPMDYMAVNNWVMLAMAKGSVSRDVLKDMKWASGADHSDWVPIVPWDGIMGRLRRIAIDVLSNLNRRWEKTVYKRNRSVMVENAEKSGQDKCQSRHSNHPDEDNRSLLKMSLQYTFPMTDRSSSAMRFARITSHPSLNLSKSSSTGNSMYSPLTVGS